MKPTLEFLKTACPQVDEKLLQHHLARLDERYFQRFDEKTVARHLRSLAKLSPEHPVEYLVDMHGNRRLEVTTLAFNYASEFSLITGLMSGLGLDIESGEIHTYAPVEQPTLRDQRRSPYTHRTKPRDYLHRRRIVDHFLGRLDTEFGLEAWIKAFEAQLRQIILLLEKGDEASQARAKHLVNEKVAQRLQSLHQSSAPVLYPVEIEINNDWGAFTRLRVVSQDTPAFLYAMSNALSVKGFSIEHVCINTVENKIEDLIDFTDNKGGKIVDKSALDQVRLSVLVTKQFTHFIGNAPDPYAALSRFEKMVVDLLQLPERGAWVDLLSNPRILQELAQLLGTSDFLWEDMIRLQYETLLPMMAPHVEGRRFADAMETLPDRLEAAMEEAESLEAQCLKLNEFKDREIFLIDLDHILTPGADFRILAEYLTYLATVIIRKAARLNYDALVNRYGRPRTVAGLETQYVILGLGKLGGAALGYASDIELLFVYGDNGRTDGEAAVTNAEFFEALVQQTSKFIRFKREGIFNIDLRLRPYGVDGPLACSLEQFCHYYDPHGQAHAVERLALVRLRAIGGDRNLGDKIERLRDEFIYSVQSINIADLRELRLKQFEEKTQGGRLNAKFSPGALVDLEYDVQILQVMYGRENKALRTPRIHQALKGLREAGVLESGECEDLNEAYNFLRNLINGLRMLRGNARDLFLPPKGTVEYVHLARRLGYIKEGGLDPGRQLHLEFETRTAMVRAFVEKHFGRDSLPGADTGNIADLILSDRTAPELRKKILSDAGFQNTERAYTNLKSLAGDAGQKEQFARLAILACDTLRRMPAPDMALNNWERFVRALEDKARHFELLGSQPMRLDILLQIFSSSQYLSNILARSTELFNWITDPQNLKQVKDAPAHARELRAIRESHPNEQQWLNAIRRYRRREYLRIGTRDVALHASLWEVTRDISNLADSLIQVVLERSWDGMRLAGKVPPAQWEDPEKHFCILAFGKLGGRELNYSSDIDLLGICADDRDSLRAQMAQQLGKDPYGLALETVSAYLSQYTEEGYVYRVDFRLRPYGSQGQLVLAVKSLLDYYGTHAALSEIQALIKARPVAGNLQLGYAFLDQVKVLLVRERKPGDIVASVGKIREIGQHPRNLRQPVLDIKSGIGGIRDIEFMVQGIQLLFSHRHPDIIHGNTLKSLELLKDHALIDTALFTQLREDYIFLRQVEHFLQILEDQQIHALPKEAEELEALGRRMLGPDSGAAQFLEDLHLRQKRVRQAYIDNFVEKYR